MASEAPSGGVNLILYNDAIVAVAGATRFHLTPAVEQLDERDPLRVFVSFMAMYALRIREGAEAGPYDNARAERFARLALMDDAEFKTMVDQRLDDRLVAGHFGVPIEQVERKRVDLDLS
jgi:hypothetical protein